MTLTTQVMHPTARLSNTFAEIGAIFHLRAKCRCLAEGFYMLAMAAANLLVVNHTLFSVLCCFGWTESSSSGLSL